MYDIIRNKESFTNIYEKEIKNKGYMNEEEIETIKKKYYEELDEELKKTSTYKPKNKFFEKNWKDIQQVEDIYEVPETGVSINELNDIISKSVSYPNDFHVHERLLKYFIQPRLNSIKNGEINWPTAEAMAFGTLLSEGSYIKYIKNKLRF
jgi:2-oxoglutarate dehydrogenase complex dehydrogenase (E1) component-like enzyme